MSWQDVPLDVFNEITYYLKDKQLLPLQFTCRSWSNITSQLIEKRERVPQDLIFTTDSVDVVKWWIDELRQPCSCERYSVAELGDLSLFRDVYEENIRVTSEQKQKKVRPQDYFSKRIIINL